MAQRYVLGGDKIKENIIVMTGTSRAGKTLLSKVLGSHKNVEWIEEPYEIYNPLIMCGLGLLDTHTLKMFFNSYVHEIIVNNVLLRNGNFRPNDLSSIWNYKSGSDIFHRLHGLYSRTDVQEYIDTEKPYFILDLPEILPFTDPIREVCENLTIINVVRNAYDVADDCLRKEWFDEEYVNSACNDLYKIHKGHRIPWWVKDGEEEAFDEATLYEKGLIYWMNIQSWERDSEKDSSRYDVHVRYEDMVKDIDGVLAYIGSKIDLKPTTITNAVKSELVAEYVPALLNRNDPNETVKKPAFNETMRRFGYVEDIKS